MLTPERSAGQGEDAGSLMLKCDAAEGRLAGREELFGIDLSPALDHFLQMARFVHFEVTQGWHVAQFLVIRAGIGYFPDFRGVVTALVDQVRTPGIDL